MSCSSIRALAMSVGVDMPITDAMHRVCHEGVDPRQAGAELLGRSQKHEWS
jgi:glycerol-3-phosphate dehydrogenase (NAD(P)+)